MTSSTPVRGKIDADTHYNPDKILDATRIFSPLNKGKKDPEVSSYRLQSFDELQVTKDSCTVDNAFILCNKAPVASIKCFIPPCDNLLEMGKKLASLDKECSYFLGSQSLVLTKDWQALASLNPYEEMTHYQVYPDGPVVEIHYSQRDNLYYICSTQSTAKLTFSFLLKIKTPENYPIPPWEISNLASYCSQFGVGSLDLTGIHNPTGKDYLQCIFQQKKGACRHRSLVFKAWMQVKYPQIPVRIIYNEIHAFVEVQIEDQWLSLDWAATPAN